MGHAAESRATAPAGAGLHARLVSDSVARAHEGGRSDGRPRAGEQRVGLVPDAARAARGLHASRSSAARARRPVSRTRPTPRRAPSSSTTPSTGVEAVVKVGRAERRRARAARAPAQLLDRLPPAADRAGADRARCARRGVLAFAMESIPRTTRAQAMDALSSQATVSGYKAALIAADRLPRFLPMLTTAAGTIAPARGARARRRRRRAAGDRDRAPAGRGRLGLRRAAGRARAGAVARRELPRPRRRRRGDARAATRAS